MLNKAGLYSVSYNFYYIYYSPNFLAVKPQRLNRREKRRLLRQLRQKEKEKITYSLPSITIPGIHCLYIYNIRTSQIKLFSDEIFDILKQQLEKYLATRREDSKNTLKSSKHTTKNWDKPIKLTVEPLKRRKQQEEMVEKRADYQEPLVAQSKILEQVVQNIKLPLELTEHNINGREQSEKQTIWLEEQVQQPEHLGEQYEWLEREKEQQKLFQQQKKLLEQTISGGDKSIKQKRRPEEQLETLEQKENPWEQFVEHLERPEHEIDQQKILIQQQEKLLKQAVVGWEKSFNQRRRSQEDLERVEQEDNLQEQFIEPLEWPEQEKKHLKLINQQEKLSKKSINSWEKSDQQKRQPEEPLQTLELIEKLQKQLLEQLERPKKEKELLKILENLRKQLNNGKEERIKQSRRPEEDFEKLERIEKLQKHLIEQLERPENEKEQTLLKYLENLPKQLNISWEKSVKQGRWPQEDLERLEQIENMQKQLLERPEKEKEQQELIKEFKNLSKHLNNEREKDVNQIRRPKEELVILEQIKNLREQLVQLEMSEQERKQQELFKKQEKLSKNPIDGLEKSVKQKRRPEEEIEILEQIENLREQLEQLELSEQGRNQQDLSKQQDILQKQPIVGWEKNMKQKKRPLNQMESLENLQENLEQLKWLKHESKEQELLKEFKILPKQLIKEWDKSVEQRRQPEQQLEKLEQIEYPQQQLVEQLENPEQEIEQERTKKLIESPRNEWENNVKLKIWPEEDLKLEAELEKLYKKLVEQKEKPLYDNEPPKKQLEQIKLMDRPVEVIEKLLKQSNQPVKIWKRPFEQQDSQSELKEQRLKLLELLLEQLKELEEITRLKEQPNLSKYTIKLKEQLQKLPDTKEFKIKGDFLRAFGFDLKETRIKFREMYEIFT